MFNAILSMAVDLSHGSVVMDPIVINFLSAIAGVVTGGLFGGFVVAPIIIYFLEKRGDDNEG